MIKKIIAKLTDEKLTIATMESCTGGALASCITDIEGASEVLKFSAVTYSNEFKIKMGVDKDIIDKYSVYSINTAREMAFNIAKFANADIGVGITGKLNRADKNNNYGKDNQVFISIFFQNKYYDLDLCVTKKTRHENKDMVIKEIIQKLGDILWKERLIK